jgi:hypothetical protein
VCEEPKRAMVWLHQLVRWVMIEVLIVGRSKASQELS